MTSTSTTNERVDSIDDDDGGGGGGGARAKGNEKTSTSTRSATEFDYTIALGSSGWLFVYYIGVVKAIRERGLQKYVTTTWKVRRIGADSRSGLRGGERGNEGEARDWLNASARFERERARVERRTDEYAFAFRSAM